MASHLSANYPTSQASGYVPGTMASKSHIIYVYGNIANIAYYQWNGANIYRRARPGQVNGWAVLGIHTPTGSIPDYSRQA